MKSLVALPLAGLALTLALFQSVPATAQQGSRTVSPVVVPKAVEQQQKATSEAVRQGQKKKEMMEKDGMSKDKKGKMSGDKMNGGAKN